jgi:hypothetical protein
VARRSTRGACALQHGRGSPARDLHTADHGQRAALDWAGFPTSAGDRLTPYDFRRLFSTEAVNGGLPVHIAAAILGHQDLNTTMGYTAIYPREVFDRYQQFLRRRRTTRPTEEYRASTAAELAEFGEHFGRRRIELGSCVPPYGTPCIHEHACLRCPFQQIDPHQLPQLHHIEDDIKARIQTARDNQWIADVTQLEQTLARVGDKRAELAALHHDAANPEITREVTGGSPRAEDATTRQVAMPRDLAAP